MKVTMLTDAPGSPDGVTVFDYANGETYEVTDALGEVFIAHGLAEETDEDTTATVEPEVVPGGEDAEDVSEDAAKQDAGPTENK